MQFHIDLPTAIEGTWKIVDDKGEVLASDKKHAGATIIIEPYFYKGQQSQVAARVAATNDKGRQVRQLLRLGANDGIAKTYQCDLPLERIQPKFDSLEPGPLTKKDKKQ